ncbi:phosphonate C-P lyase system protein PhnG [Jiella sonneratiae]|uniref:Phosphonate C-P lyase system protein PhnG n=1 Tax=Jiella sonneratiae TaxID=2816856 RepID=A0ABS3J904_9HYPH|nr:phosphonate C-P lyase system protein PhnG [Jiella sonneratiae]MBO0906153.1 phosphonate C-P lyase system protein PhnG [Jiella sonneratiae]
MTDDPGRRAEAEKRGGARRRTVSAFAQAGAGFLSEAWDRLGAGRTVAVIRGPETGLVMVRGRAGGGGAPFNLGEASVTRASVRLDGETVGHAMVLGRDGERARLAAAFDALWQVEAARGAVEREVVAAVEAAIASADRDRRAETEATKVDFFTMMRGED